IRRLSPKERFLARVEASGFWQAGFVVHCVSMRLAQPTTVLSIEPHTAIPAEEHGTKKQYKQHATERMPRANRWPTTENESNPIQTGRPERKAGQRCVEK